MLTNSEKLLKRYPVVLILMTALYLVSCSPTKKAMSAKQQLTKSIQEQSQTQQERTIDSTANSLTSGSRISQLGIEMLTELESNEQVITTVFEYDTSLPIDSLTGKHPLKKETKSTHHSTNTGKQMTNSGQTIDEKSDASSQVHKEQSDKSIEKVQGSGQTTVDTKVDVSSKKGMPAVCKVLIGIGIAAILALLIWFGGKIKRKLLIK